MRRSSFLAGTVVLGVFLSAALADGRRAVAAGRALTPAEMAAIHGDTAYKCIKEVPCTNSYPVVTEGKTLCTKCDKSEKKTYRCCDTATNPNKDCEPIGGGNTGCSDANRHDWASYDPTNVGTCGLCSGMGVLTDAKVLCFRAQATGGPCDEPGGN
jgi:hypothetical protein